MAERQTVTEDIGKVIRGGLVVHGADGERIGIVKDYSMPAGYLVVQTGLVAHKDLYVPFSVIASIDPKEIYLSLNKDVLTGEYGAPPPTTIVVEGDSAREVVRSGYDGSPTEINRVDLQMVRRELAKGMTVYALDGEKMGAVDGIDAEVGYMLVKQHHLNKTDLFIPFAAITTIDKAYTRVFLGAPRDALVKEYSRLPYGIVLRIDAIAVAAEEHPEHKPGKQ
jgi:hypothetical protein